MNEELVKKRQLMEGDSLQALPRGGSFNFLRFEEHVRKDSRSRLSNIVVILGGFDVRISWVIIVLTSEESGEVRLALVLISSE